MLWDNLLTFIPRPFCKHDCLAARPGARKHEQTVKRDPKGS